MSAQLSRIMIALCGILGTVLLGLYFGVGFSVGLAQLPPDTTAAQVVNIGIEYRNLWFLGTWLQATGSLLSVIFFLALVQRAGRTASLSGLLTIVGSAVLLAVVLVEGVFTIDLAQAAVSGHPTTSLASFDIMSVFTYVYPIVPAPVIFLALGTILLGSHLLPRVLGYLAFGLGIAFAVRGIDRSLHDFPPYYRRSEPSGALGPGSSHHLAGAPWERVRSKHTILVASIGQIV